MVLQKKIINETLNIPLGAAAYAVIELLMDNGFDAWWVGGCVRDMLLGNIPGEIDIGTAATPDDVLRLFPKHDPKGRKFGSVIVHHANHSFEVTTFREDDEASDGRRPESVVFGTHEQDAKRRDITLNAMYFHPISRELYDPFNGEADLQEKLVRIIGEPGMRLKHDALRLLRVVRFRARIAGQYHPETYTALREQAPLIEGISGFRIFEEFEKMLLGPRPDRALEDLWELGILQYILPELAECKGVPQPGHFHEEGDVWEHLLECTRQFRPEDGMDVRIAALFHDTGKAQTFSLKKRIMFEEHASVSAKLAKAALDRLQCSADRREKIVWLIEHHMMMGSFVHPSTGSGQAMPEKRKAHWYFHPWFPELLALFYLDAAGTKPQDFEFLDRIIADRDHFLDTLPRPPKPLLTGNDVMKMLGIDSGKRVGEVLSALHEAQVEGKVKTRKEAEEFVRRSGR